MNLSLCFCLFVFFGVLVFQLNIIVFVVIDIFIRYFRCHFC